MEKILSIISFLFVFCNVINAQVTVKQHTLDSIQSQFIKETQQDLDEFDEYVKTARANYKKYEIQARADYAKYVTSIQNVWGNDTVVDNTKYTWVEYGENLKDRSIVDFQSGTIDVEVMVDEDSSDQDTQDALIKAIERLFQSRGSTCPYVSSVDVSEPISKDPILEGLIDFSPYDLSSLDSIEVAPQKKLQRQTPPKPVSQGKDLKLEQHPSKTQQTHHTTTAHQKSLLASIRLSNQKKAEALLKQKRMEAEKRKLAKLILAQSKQEVIPVKPAVNSSKKSTKTVRINMRLVASNLSKNAALYKDIVKEYSVRFSIEEPLIYAVIEQESSFNPEATSWVPAYGLMQLVPQSGGLAAYRFVYKTDWAPTRSYLFVPRNNVELGTAYLRVLMNQFASVTDPDCRRLCVIASYNTGAGNVSRSFTGRRNLNGEVFTKINQLNYQGLFHHLTNRLNTNEARNYVRGVTRRREKYL